jgi:hypothetical protein
MQNFIASGDKCRLRLWSEILGGSLGCWPASKRFTRQYGCRTESAKRETRLIGFMERRRRFSRAYIVATVAAKCAIESFLSPACLGKLSWVSFKTHCRGKFCGRNAEKIIKSLKHPIRHVRNVNFVETKWNAIHVNPTCLRKQSPARSRKTSHIVV